MQAAFVSFLSKHYPDLREEVLTPLISENLLCPFTIKLPHRVFNDLKVAVQSVHSLRTQLLKARGDSFPDHLSTMMSLDFHLDGEQKPKLIEVNTNASFLILGWEMYRFRGLPFPTSFSPSGWKQNLLNDFSDWKKAGGKSSSEIPSVAIVDESPPEQRLYAEFLVAREWLKSTGFKAEIRDVHAALEAPKPDLIYNRSTDFSLEHLPDLRTAYLKREVCLTPNPSEYSLLADKERMVEWNQIHALKEILPACEGMNFENKDDLWARRRSLFFKPKREFGSKKAYRGSSISRKHFDEVLGEDMIAQELVPPSEITFETPKGPQVFKYDLRCHFHGDQLQGVVARVYQGQVTNLRTEFGGFAPVVFE